MKIRQLLRVLVLEQLLGDGQLTGSLDGAGSTLGTIL
jgi:hypothetical protein